MIAVFFPNLNLITIYLLVLLTTCVVSCPSPLRSLRRNFVIAEAPRYIFVICLESLNIYVPDSTPLTLYSPFHHPNWHHLKSHVLLPTTH